MFLGKALRAFSDKVNVRAFLQDQPRSPYGIADMLYATYAAGAQSSAVHHQGIQLDPPIAGKKAAAAGVEGIVIFH